MNKRIRILLLTVFSFFFLGSEFIYGCGGADQNRIFLIGANEDYLFYLEIKLKRSDLRNVPEIKDHAERFQWNGITSLISRNMHGEKLTLKFDTIFCVQNDYIDTLSKYYANYSDFLASNYTFSKAELFDWEYFNISSYRADIDTTNSCDSIDCKVIISGNEYSIDYPDSYYYNSTGFGSKLYKGPYYALASIKSYKVNKTTYYIVNMNSGDYGEMSVEYCNEIIDEFKRKKKGVFEKNLIYPEITQYHGVCFDGIIEME